MKYLMLGIVILGLAACQTTSPETVRQHQQINHGDYARP